MVTHTGGVLYNCPYCNKPFNCRSNLHKHRKSAHPKEFAETCRKKLNPYCHK